MIFRTETLCTNAVRSNTDDVCPFLTLQNVMCNRIELVCTEFVKNVSDLVEKSTFG